MKKSMFDKKQKGFTLLELLVVITLLAILSVGALVAYEGIGDTAQATAASNNTAGADQAIRNYRAVTQSYPSQWDNLVVASGEDETGTPVAATGTAGTLPTFFNANVMDTWLGNLNLATASPQVAAALEEVGIVGVQTRLIDGATLNVEPNLQHNEGAVKNTTDVLETDTDALTDIAVVPTNGAAGACGLETGTYPAATLDGAAVGLANGNFINKINDSLENDSCNLVVALGFGHDAAHSTNGSSVAISTAPTFVSQNINPNTQYARYIALFQVGHDADGDDVIQNTEIFEKARLIAVVDTEGHVIDENIADANVK
jgi:prepilin-type N-terminal cleavage/methylation domain-containing protein